MSDVKSTWKVKTADAHIGTSAPTCPHSKSKKPAKSVAIAMPGMSGMPGWHQWTLALLELPVYHALYNGPKITATGHLSSRRYILSQEEQS